MNIRSCYPVSRLSLIWLAGFVLFLYGRYGAGTAIYWHQDDFFFMLQAGGAESVRDVWRQIFPHPHRMLGYLQIYSFYYWFADQPHMFWVTAVVGYAVVLWFFLLAVWLLSKSLVTTLLAVILFSLWPNLTENFHWPNIMSGFAGRGILGILGGLVAWAYYWQTGRRYAYWLAVAGYAYALAFGEGAAPLPGALFFLIPYKEYRKALWLMLPFAGVLSLYVIYRFTNAFGYGMVTTTYAEHHFQIRPTLFMLYWQGTEYLSRWVGLHMLRNIAGGWLMLLDAPAALARLLVLVNFIVATAVVVVLGIIIRKEGYKPMERGPWGPFQMVLFCIAWLGVFFLPMWVAHSEPRMMFLPSVGASLLVAYVLGRWWPRWVPVMVGIWCFIALGANQGTNLAWQEAGRFNQALYREIKASHTDWTGKTVVLFDSTALRNRMEHRLVGEPQMNVLDIARYHNATFLRDFYLGHMMSLAIRDLAEKGVVVGVRPQPVLDIQCNARWVDDTLHWHERFHPDRKHQTPRSEVHVIDMDPSSMGANR